MATAVSGVLTNSNTSAPIAGEPVTLTLDATETCTGTTDATGTATCFVTPGEAKGTYPLTGTFAGDSTLVPALLASNGSNTFVVTPDPTAIIYTGDTTATNGPRPRSRACSPPSEQPLPNNHVTLTLGSGGTAQFCSATTDAVRFGQLLHRLGQSDRRLGAGHGHLRRGQLLPVLDRALDRCW